MTVKPLSTGVGKGRGLGATALVLIFILLLLCIPPAGAQSPSVSFTGTGLNGINVNNPTSLQFGPDGRLYVSQQNAMVKAYTIARNGPNDYEATATEEIDLVKNFIPNHNDDGTSNSSQSRQVTGILMTGTSTNPVLYVSSSDGRIGAGSKKGDVNLDTNSGVISRLTWTGSAWDKVDIVRGLPRSEENHSVNGMELDEATNTLYLAVGGHTNAGAPSNNFAFTTEYTYSAAIIAVDLDEIESRPILEDTTLYNNYTYKWVYDLPTVDDPTRPNVNGIDDPDDENYDGVDPNDPFGGNDGLNQAKIDTSADAPISLYASGFRNLYDIEFTENGRMYGVDNGANGGWGGHPAAEVDYPVDKNGVGNQVPGTCTNNYIAGEPGSSGSGPGGDAKVNNKNGLHFIADLNGPNNGGYYGGHPAPIRANPAGAGLYTKNDTYNPTGLLRTQKLEWDNADFAAQSLPVDWPPVPVSMANPIECDFRNSGVDDGALANFGSSTNGIAEYTASNFEGQLQGVLLAASFGGDIYGIVLSDDGTVAENCPANTVNNCDSVASSLLSGFGSTPLDVIAQGDLDPFGGTIWAATYGANAITVFEPADYDGSDVPLCEGTDSDDIDEDGDGYTNADEIDNNTNPCSPASKPSDYDQAFEFGDNNQFLRSDLNDPDDDNDGIPDINDPFMVDATNGLSYSLPIVRELFNSTGFGFGGVGFTGLMIDNVNDYVSIGADSAFVPNASDVILGGTGGQVTIPNVTVGDAYQSNNTQDHAYQFGVNVSNLPNGFTASGRIEQAFFNSSAPGNFRSQGIQIGPGDQDNYVKLVLSRGTSASGSGFQLMAESGGTVGTNVVDINVANVLDAEVIDLYISVDPTAATATGFYAIDGGPRQLVGTVNLSGAMLDVLDGTYQINGVPSGMAVGMIATAYGQVSNPEFAANWSRFEVLPNGAPQLINPLEDVTVQVDSEPTNIEIADVFTDDGGPTNLTYAVTGNTNTGLVSTSLTGTTLQLSFAPDTSGAAEITVTATDSTSETASDTFLVTVNDAPQVLLRLNAGGNGPAVDYVDQDGNTWVDDAPYLDDVAGNAYTSANGNGVTGIPYPLTAPIYVSERSGAAGWEYAIPVPNGTYTIEFHLAEIYFGAPGGGSGGGVGSRVFDVDAEDVKALDDYDIVAEAGGSQIAVVETVTNIVVSDGVLDIVGVASVNQPKLSALAIYSQGGVGPVETPINVEPIPNQVNAEGDEIANLGLAVAASGGDGNLAYSISGAPAGVQVEPTNGQIFGTIATGAAANSPYTVTITVDDSDDNPNDTVETTFQWIVTDPNATETVLYRVNNGGPQVAATDGGPAWSADQSATSKTAGGAAVEGTPSQYLDLTDPATDTTFSPSADYDISALGNNTTGAPDAIFATERWSITANPNNMKWAFPVDNGDYIVNLYFAENWSKVKEPGIRVFGVNVEGAPFLENYDVYVAAGNTLHVATLETTPVSVADGTLNIDFVKGVQNPAVKGIEIIFVGPSDGNQPPMIVLSEMGAKANEEDTVTFDVTSVTDPDTDAITDLSVALTDDADDSPVGGFTFTPAADNTSGAFEWTIPTGTAGKTYTATVSASDGAATSEMAFAIEVLDPNAATDTVLYRINVGGPEVATADGSEPAWSQDDAASPSPFRVAGTNNIYNGNSVSAHPGPIIMTDPSIPPYAPAAIFNTERFDLNNNSPDEMLWQFPVTPGDDIEVRLYFAELFNGNGTNGIDAAGKRVFDVSVNGTIPTAFNDIDPFAVAGAKGAFMRSTTLTAGDNTLDIEFIHVVENPALKGIEIIKKGTNGPDLPTLTLLSPTEGEVIVVSSVTVEWEASFDIDGYHVHVRLDDEPYIGGNPLTGTWTFTDVAPGPHTIEIELAEDNTHFVFPASVQTVSFTVQAEDTSVATLNGALTIQGRTDYSGAVEVGLYTAAGTPVETFTPAVDAAGNFEITGIVPGTYQVRVKGPQTLAVVETLALAGGSNSADFGELPTGDANDDNQINTADLAVVQTTYNLASTDAAYDARADFNGDGQVSAVDFSLMNTNFNTTGEEPSGE